MQKNFSGVYIDIDTIKTGENISFFRKMNGLSQADLAEIVNVSTKTISYWERGLRLISIVHLASLSYVLGVKTDDILCYTAKDVILLLFVIYC